MNLKHSNLIIIALLIFLAGKEPLMAQTSAYHSIVFPYEVNQRHVLTRGGLISAVPDPFSSLQMNPGGLAFFNRPALGANFTFRTANYRFDYTMTDQSVNENIFKNEPGLVTAVMPISVLEQKIVLAIAGQHLHAPEFELWEEFNHEPGMDLRHERDGNVWNVNLALATQLSKNLGIGLNISQWLGSWVWQESLDDQTLGRGTFQYPGTGFALGLLYQRSKLNLGLTLYSPLTLMTSSDTRNEFWFRYSTNHLEQNFHGAVRLGMNYALTCRTQLGLDYRWQGRSLMKGRIVHEASSYSYRDTIGVSHQLSLAVGQDVNAGSLKLPLFIGYQMTFMPVTRPGFFGDYQRIIIDQKNNLRHTLMAGAQLLYNAYGFYLSTRWDYGSVHIWNQMTPPWS